MIPIRLINHEPRTLEEINVPFGLYPVIKTKGDCVILHRAYDPWYKGGIFDNVISAIEELYSHKKYLFLLSLHDDWCGIKQIMSYLPYIEFLKKQNYKTFFYNTEDLTIFRKIIELYPNFVNDVELYKNKAFESFEATGSYDVKFKTEYYDDKYNNLYSLYTTVLMLYYFKKYNGDVWLDFSEANEEMLKLLFPNETINFKFFIPISKNHISTNRVNTTKPVFFGSIPIREDNKEQVTLEKRLNIFRRQEILTNIDFKHHSHSDPISKKELKDSDYGISLDLKMNNFRESPDYLRIFDTLNAGMLPVAEAAKVDNCYDNTIFKYNENFSTDTTEIATDLNEKLLLLKDSDYFKTELARCLTAFNDINKSLIKTFNEY